MEAGLPTGDFTCPITFESVRPPRPVVKKEGGVTYVVQGDYEIAFQTVLRFASGKELSIRAKLFGENSQKVVVRDQDGRPAALSGYTQGAAKSSTRTRTSSLKGDTTTRGPIIPSQATTP